MSMIANKQEQKAKAIELLKTLDIYKPYIKGFEDNDEVCFFERFGGYWINQETKAYAKMKEFEKTHECTVYAVTHEYLEFGECWSFLFVPKYKEDWTYMLRKYKNTFCVMAYVWNSDCEWCSDMGDIEVRSFGGGLCRVG